MAQTILLHQLSIEELQALLTKVVAEQLKLQAIGGSQETDTLLTRAETCEFLKVDSSTLWHWTKKGKLTAYGIGHRRYYKKQEIIENLKAVKA